MEIGVKRPIFYKDLRLESKYKKAIHISLHLTEPRAKVLWQSVRPRSSLGTPKGNNIKKERKFGLTVLQNITFRQTKILSKTPTPFKVNQKVSKKGNVYSPRIFCPASEADYYLNIKKILRKSLVASLNVEKVNLSPKVQKKS